MVAFVFFRIVISVISLGQEQKLKRPTFSLWVGACKTSCPKITPKYVKLSGAWPIYLFGSDLAAPALGSVCCLLWVFRREVVSCCCFCAMRTGRNFFLQLRRSTRTAMFCISAANLCSNVLRMMWYAGRLLSTAATTRLSLMKSVIAVQPPTCPCAAIASCDVPFNDMTVCGSWSAVYRHAKNPARWHSSDGSKKYSSCNFFVHVWKIKLSFEIDKVSVRNSSLQSCVCHLGRAYDVDYDIGKSVGTHACGSSETLVPPQQCVNPFDLIVV